MKRIYIFFVLVALFPVSHLKAEEIVVYMNESMPFCGTEDGKSRGIAVEILNELSIYGGPQFKFESLPWKRAQAYVQKNKGTGIIPFTRTDAREKNHMWIVKLFSNKVRLTAAKNTIRDVPLPSPFNIENVAGLRVGIIRGSAEIPFLRKTGFTSLIEANNARENVRALHVGSISAMIESKWVDTYFWNKAGFSSKDLIIGPEVGEDWHIYLGAALDFPSHKAEQIRNAMVVIKRNGRLDSILNKWR